MRTFILVNYVQNELKREKRLILMVFLFHVNYCPSIMSISVKVDRYTTFCDGITLSFAFYTHNFKLAIESELISLGFNVVGY